MNAPLEPTSEFAGTLIVVCGLEAEAKIARSPGILVIKGGGDLHRLAADIDRAAAAARAILSFGVAGGLAPGLTPGTVRVGAAIVAPDGRRFATDPTWSDSIAAVLAAQSGTILGVDAPLGDIAAKAAARKSTGADLVDMESHVVARAAERYGLKLAALRIVTDPAERSLPHAALVGMRPDGHVDLAAILTSLARNPGQLPGLIRTGLDARAAFASLFRCRQRLGPRFALLDL